MCVGELRQGRFQPLPAKLRVLGVGIVEDVKAVLKSHPKIGTATVLSLEILKRFGWFSRGMALRRKKLKEAEP